MNKPTEEEYADEVLAQYQELLEWFASLEKPKPDPVREEAQRLTKASDRLRHLQSMRQAKVHMIALWRQEIWDIDEEVKALIERDPHLALHGYPQWLVELM